MPYQFEVPLFERIQWLEREACERRVAKRTREMEDEARAKMEVKEMRRKEEEETKLEVHRDREDVVIRPLSLNEERKCR